MVPNLVFKVCVASVKRAMIAGLTAKEHVQKGKKGLSGMGLIQESLRDRRISVNASMNLVVTVMLPTAERHTEQRSSLPSIITHDGRKWLSEN